jgi:hypothetical protein
MRDRSVGDCVRFYYRNQKLDEFAAVRRKQQLKKRRLQTQEKSSRQYLGGRGAAAAQGALQGLSPPRAWRYAQARRRQSRLTPMGSWQRSVHERW